MSVQTYYTVVGGPIGDVLVVSAPSQGDVPVSIAGVYLTGQRYEPHLRPDWTRDESLLADASKQLDAYFAGDLTDFDLPLTPHGTPFQEAVWMALRDIPFGTTCAYGQIAERVADRTKTRAVAAAIGRNPIGIVVPCHRVVGADGSLTGYAGGIDRKRWLLDHEASIAGVTLPLRSGSA